MESICITSLGATTTYFVGRHYEVTDGVVTKYYGVYGAASITGATRIAIPQGDDVRKNGTLYYLLGDHASTRPSGRQHKSRLNQHRHLREGES